MSEMVERVARALAESAGCSFDDAMESSRQGWWRAAGLAIAALREPTEAMREAGTALILSAGTMSGFPIDINPPPDQAWRAMIDAALK